MNAFWTAPFLPNLLNSTVFLVETSQMIAVFFTNYKGNRAFLSHFVLNLFWFVLSHLQTFVIGLLNHLFIYIHEPIFLFMNVSLFIYSLLSYLFTHLFMYLFFLPFY